MTAGTLYTPGLWQEPFALRPAVSRLLLPFSVISAAIRQQQSRRRRGAIVASPDTTVYVSKAGSDVNTGLTIGAPVLTFSRAATIAQTTASITTVEVQGTGTWHETWTFPRNNLTFTAPSGVVIDGDGVRDGINYGSKTGCMVDGDVEITNTGAGFYAIVANGVAGVVIDGPVIHDCPRGVLLDTCASPQVRNLDIDTISTQHGVEFNGCVSPIAENIEGSRCKLRVIYLYGTTGFTVRDCYAHDGNDVTDYGFECEAGSNDGLFVDSWSGGIPDGGNPFAYGFISKTSYRTRFQRLVALGCRGTGSVGAGIYFKASHDSVAYHNDVYDCVNGFRLGQDNTTLAESTNITLRNNIIKNNTVGIVIATASDGTFDADLYHGNSTAMSFPGTASYSTFANLQAAGYEPNGLSGDPLYSTVTYGGFALGGGSPALAAGVDLGEGSAQNLGHTGSTFGA